MSDTNAPGSEWRVVKKRVGRQNIRGLFKLEPVLHGCWKESYHSRVGRDEKASRELRVLVELEVHISPQHCEQVEWPLLRLDVLLRLKLQTTKQEA